MFRFWIRANSTAHPYADSRSSRSRAARLDIHPVPNLHPRPKGYAHSSHCRAGASDDRYLGGADADHHRPDAHSHYPTSDPDSHFHYRAGAPDGNSHCLAGADGDRCPDGDARSHSHAHTWPGANSDTDCYADAQADTNAHADTEAGRTQRLRRRLRTGPVENRGVRL